MKKGVTPVISVALMLVIAVAGAAVVYQLFQDFQNSGTETDVSGDAQLAVANVECAVEETSKGKIYISVRNWQKTGADASNVDMKVTNEDGGQMMFENLDWSSYDFTEPQGSDLVSVPVAEANNPQDLENGKIYNIKITFPQYELETKNCQATSGSSLTLPTDDPEEGPEVLSDYSETNWQDSPQSMNLDCNPDPPNTCEEIEWKMFDSRYNLVDEDTVSGDSVNVDQIGQNNEGVMYVQYRGTNSNGDTGPWNFKAVKIDKNPPQSPSISTDLASPPNGNPDGAAWYGNEGIDVEVEEPEDGGNSDISGCYYRIQDGSSSWGDWKLRQCGQLEVSVGNGEECTQEGPDACRVELRIEDLAGNSEYYSGAFNIDTKKPETSIAGPDPTEEYTESFDVTATDSDSNLDLAECQYRVSYDSTTGDWKPRECNDDFTVTVGDSGLCPYNMNCEVETRVTDQAGNTATDTEVYSTQEIELVDGSFPEYFELSPGESGSFSSGQDTLTSIDIEDGFLTKAYLKSTESSGVGECEGSVINGVSLSAYSASDLSRCAYSGTMQFSTGTYDVGICDINGGTTYATVVNQGDDIVNACESGPW